MMDSGRFTELVPAPETGRVFQRQQFAGFADAAPSGRVRLDALARWLQDVAYADVEDAGLADGAVWVVRRTRLRVRRFPRFAEPITLRTFCSGLGRMWAERRTSIVRPGSRSDPDVEAVSLWVHLDSSTWRPAPLGEQELKIYGDAANERRVTARLRHPPPGHVADTRTWRFRATECDIAGHINNAAYWTPVEEELLSEGGPATGEPESLDAEIEYRIPAQPGEKQLLRDGNHWWIVGPEREVHASLLVARPSARATR
jgi:acyl-ACP thioesterase